MHMRSYGRLEMSRSVRRVCARESSSFLIVLSHVMSVAYHNIHVYNNIIMYVHTHTHQEGLFSDGGRSSEIEDIMNMLDTGGRELPGSAYSVASALLTFLAALADPVVPFALHQRCMDCYNNTTLCKQVCK